MGVPKGTNVWREKMQVIDSKDAPRRITLATSAFNTALESGREAVSVNGKSDVADAFSTALDNLERNASKSWSRSQVIEAALIAALKQGIFMVEELATHGRQAQASSLAGALGEIIPPTTAVDEELKVPLTQLRALCSKYLPIV